MLSCLVFGWDLVLCPVLRTPIDRSRRAQRLPLPRLGISPQSPSGSQLWAVTPGLLRPLVPVQMTPGRHPDGVLSSCLASPGVWECPWIPSVPGGARVALSLHSPSRWTCHQASLQVHSPPTSHAHTPGPGCWEGIVAQFTMSWEPQSCNCNSGEKWKHSYFRIYLP